MAKKSGKSTPRPATPAKVNDRKPAGMKAAKAGTRARTVEDRYGNFPIR